MKQSLIFSALMVMIALTASAQQYKVITTVESIVPAGIGRSRIIDERQNVDYKNATTSRETKGDGDKQKEVDRGGLRIDKFEETKLLNFYSVTGINFQNIATNDAMISSKINSMFTEGWDLIFVTSGVESDGGTGDGNGIFITRFIFYKKS